MHTIHFWLERWVKALRYLTTNFDRCIESACRIVGLNPPVLIYREDFEAPSVDSPFLAKLHGCVSDLDTIQATTRSIATAGAGWRVDEPKTRFLTRLAARLTSPPTQTDPTGSNRSGTGDQHASA
jgi:SIR2-like protein